MKNKNFVAKIAAAVGVAFTFFSAQFYPLLYVIVCAAVVLVGIGAMLLCALEVASVIKEMRECFRKYNKKIGNKDKIERLIKGEQELTARDTTCITRKSLARDYYLGQIVGKLGTCCVRVACCAAFLFLIALWDNENKNNAFAAMKQAMSTLSHSLKLNVDEPQKVNTNEAEQVFEADKKVEQSSGDAENSPLEQKTDDKPDEVQEETISMEIVNVEVEQTSVLHMYQIPSPEESIEIPFGLLRSVFYYDETEDLETEVRVHLAEVRAEQRQEESVTNIRDSKKRDVSYLSIWKNEVEGGYALVVTANDIAQWNENAADISVLLEIIQGREEILAKVDNSGLCVLIANDYQRYGLEYQKMENGNAEQILWGYMNSISYAEKALMFEGKTDAECKDILEYMMSRYKDIADCERIDSSIRNRAREIECIMRDLLEAEALRYSGVLGENGGVTPKTHPEHVIWREEERVGNRFIG